MKRTEFVVWLNDTNVSPRVIRDHVSRINRLERVFSSLFGESFSLENEYAKDQCKYLFSLLKKRGSKLKQKRYDNINLPIGKPTMGSIRYSLRAYCRFLEKRYKVG